MNHTDKEIYKKARKTVKKKKDFYGSLISFFGFGIFLQFSHMNWLSFIMFFWGISLIKDYIDLFGFPGGPTGEDWEEEELAREIVKEQRLRGYKTRATEDRFEFPEKGLELRELKKQPREWDDRNFV